MASDFESIVRDFAAPQAVDLLGDRNADGTLAKIRYYPPDSNSDPFEWPAIVKGTRFEDAFDADSERMKRRELLEVVVTREAMAADGVLEFQRRARVEVRGRAYALDKTTTKFNAGLATLGLVATPLEELSGRRDAI